MKLKSKVTVTKRVHNIDPATDKRLKTLARRYGKKTLRRWFYDDEPPYVTPLIEYVRMCGTWVGYRAFVRKDEAQEFVYRLQRLPRWVDRQPAY